jgi:hypothetical protein
MQTRVGAVNGFFIFGRCASLAMYSSELFPTYMRATAMTVVFNTRPVIAAIATLAGALVIETFGGAGGAAVVVGLLFSVTLWIGPETWAKPLAGADDLAEPPSHSHVFAAE